MLHVGFLEPKAVKLIQNIEYFPVLYDQTLFHNVARAEKQRLWDAIAKRTGYTKTEEAKSKWRSLTTYFRQVLDNVAKKAIRRYIPKTGNPADKYVQLTDWRYYKYMKFMEPILKKQLELKKVNGTVEKKQIPASTVTRKVNLNSTTSTTDNIVTAGHPVTTTLIAKKQQQSQLNIAETTTSTTTQLKNDATFARTPTSAVNTATPKHLKFGNLVVRIEVDGNVEHAADATVPNAEEAANPIADSVTSTPFYELSINDQNLKIFFDAMLRSAQRLPKFHQERVKRKLITNIRKQQLCKY